MYVKWKQKFQKYEIFSTYILISNSEIPCSERYIRVNQKQNNNNNNKRKKHTHTPFWISMCIDVSPKTGDINVIHTKGIIKMVYFRQTRKLRCMTQNKNRKQNTERENGFLNALWNHIHHPENITQPASFMTTKIKTASPQIMCDAKEWNK